MKVLRYGLVILGIFILALVIQKVYLTYKYNSYQPTIETKSSIIQFLDEIGGIDVNSVYLLKDSSLYAKMDNLFGLGKIYIFDGNGNVLDNNIKKENGTCHADITKKMCHGDDLKNSKFVELIKGRFDTLNNNIIPLILSDNSQENLQYYDFIVLYPWAKYYPVSYEKSNLEFIECLKKNYKNFKIIALNFDNIQMM